MKKKLIAVLMAATIFTGAIATSCKKMDSAKADATRIKEHNDAIGTVEAEIEPLIGNQSAAATSGADSALGRDATEASQETEQDFNTEEYNVIKENSFVKVADAPLSTFAADVDTGTYCNLRRMINGGWDLKNLAGQGVEIISCGTCLNFYGLSDKLEAGTVSNMYEILEKMQKSSNTITL